MDHDDNDKLIIDIATGEEIVDPAKINKFIANPDAFKKEMMVLCRQCYVDQLTKSLEHTIHDEEKHERIHRFIYTTIRHDVSIRVLQMMNDLDEKYPDHPDTVKDAIFGEFVFNCEFARLALKKAGWTRKDIMDMESPDIEYAREIDAEEH